MHTQSDVSQNDGGFADEAALIEAADPGAAMAMAGPGAYASGDGGVQALTSNFLNGLSASQAGRRQNMNAQSGVSQRRQNMNVQSDVSQSGGGAGGADGSADGPAAAGAGMGGAYATAY